MRTLHSRDDQDLKGRFQALRDEDQQQVPDFEKVMARVRAEAATAGEEIHPLVLPHRSVPRKLAWGGSLLAAAATATLLLIQLAGTSDSEFVQVVQGFSNNPAAGAWRSPTDGLLKLPGSEILSTFPSVGESPWLSGIGSAPRRNEL